MIINSNTAIKSIESGEASYEGVTVGHGDLNEIEYAILTNHEHCRTDHVEIEKHIKGEDFEAIVLETGIVLSNNSAGTECYPDYEEMVASVGECFREEFEALF